MRAVANCPRTAEYDLRRLRSLAESSPQAARFLEVTRPDIPRQLHSLIRDADTWRRNEAAMAYPAERAAIEATIGSRVVVLHTSRESTRSI